MTETKTMLTDKTQINNFQEDRRSYKVPGHRMQINRVKKVMAQQTAFKRQVPIRKESKSYG